MRNLTVLFGDRGRILDYILRTEYPVWTGLSTGSPRILFPVAPRILCCVVREIEVLATGTRFSVTLVEPGGVDERVRVDVRFKNDINLLKAHMAKLWREAAAARVKKDAAILKEVAKELERLEGKTVRQDDGFLKGTM